MHITMEIRPHQAFFFAHYYWNEGEFGAKQTFARLPIEFWESCNTMKADEVLCGSDSCLHLVPLCCNTRELRWPWSNQCRRNTIQSKLLSVPNAKYVFGGCTVLHSALRKKNKKTIYTTYALYWTSVSPFYRQYMLPFKIESKTLVQLIAAG